MRIDNIEFRRMEDRDPEIVCWNGVSCYTLMWFKKDREGYYIKFIGNRPFDGNSSEKLWELMRYGQGLLDNEFRFLERLREY